MTTSANSRQTTVSDDIVRKIQLLLNLAERAEGNEAEAAAAMGKAQEILAKYNLDLAMVQDKVVAGGTTKTAEDVKREKAESKRSTTYEWTRTMMKAVAEANYCACWVTEIYNAKRGRFNKKYVILGRVDNTRVVLLMTDYLYATISRLNPYKDDSTGWLSADALAWCDGCVERLVERINAKNEEMRTPDYAAQGEQGYCTAIAVRDMAKAEEIGNYDARHGAGAWAAKEKRQADYEAGREVREVRRREENMRLEAEKAAKLLAETPADRARRLKAEARQRRADAAYSHSYWAREDRKDAHREARRSSHAFQSGHAAAENIGLDGQLGSTTEKSLS